LTCRMTSISPAAFARFGRLSLRSSKSFIRIVRHSSNDMNSKPLRLALLIASALLVLPRSAHAISYTFDVDASSGIGAGFFSIDLPAAWPGNIGQTTLFQTTSFSGSRAPGDAWVTLSIALSEPLAPHPNTAVIFGTSGIVPSFSTTAGVGITPADAVDAIPGISRRTVGVADGGVTAVLLGASFLGLLIWRRRQHGAA